MTRARLLEEADSAELSGWAIYFEVADERAREHQNQAAIERRILGDTV